MHNGSRKACKTLNSIQCGDADHDPILVKYHFCSFKFVKPGADAVLLPQRAQVEDSNFVQVFRTTYTD